MTQPHARRAGVCLHITSLPGPYGIGALGDAARWFVDRLHQCGMSLWQVLPTGPTGYADSPYQLLSVFAGNPMLIDLDALANAGLVRQAELDALPAGQLDEVCFGDVVPAREALLAKAAARFDARAHGTARDEFDRFCRQHAARWLTDYARYSVLKTMHGGAPWYAWPDELANAEPQALERLEQEEAEALRHVRIVQYLFLRQWAALRQYAAARGVRLIGDAPIYVAHDSADTWARRDLFQFDEAGHLAAVGGVPPDYFSADGQLWGNPLYDWAHHAEHGFQWWIDRLSHACTLTDLVRIDHFRGFEAYWSVAPDADTARAGRWIEGPGAALFDALRDALPTLPIIAEDLGLITPAVQALRQRYGLPGMAVLQFLVEEDGFDPAHIGEDRVCYTGTHDNDTTRGWFDRGDAPEDHARRARVLTLTGGEPENAPADLLDMALQCPARYAVFPMQDVLGLGSDSRFNTPGTTADNWRWRLRAQDVTDALCKDVARRVAVADRSPAH